VIGEPDLRWPESLEEPCIGVGATIAQGCGGMEGDSSGGVHCRRNGIARRLQAVRCGIYPTMM
jgi:hypothetical protein